MNDNTKIRPAEEIAREMVQGTRVVDGDGRAVVEFDSILDGLRLVGVLTRLIEQSRAEGAAAERARVRAEQHPTAEAAICTGISARWCPVHGDCTCPDESDLCEEWCPLHGLASSHAEEAETP